MSWNHCLIWLIGNFFFHRNSFVCYRSGVSNVISRLLFLSHQMAWFTLLLTFGLQCWTSDDLDISWFSIVLVQHEFCYFGHSCVLVCLDETFASSLLLTRHSWEHQNCRLQRFHQLSTLIFTIFFRLSVIFVFDMEILSSNQIYTMLWIESYFTFSSFDFFSICSEIVPTFCILLLK